MSSRRALLAAALWLAIPSLAFAQNFYFQELASYYSGPYGTDRYPGTRHTTVFGPGVSFMDDQIDVTYGYNDWSLSCGGAGCTESTTRRLLQLSKPLSGGTASSQTVHADGQAPFTAFSDVGYRNVFYTRRASVSTGSPLINQLWQAWKAPNTSTWNHLVVDGTSDGAGASVNGSTSAMQAVRYGGTNHIFYIEDKLFRLRHVRRDPATSTWQYAVLDGDGGPNGRLDVNLSGASQALSVIVYGNHIHVFYIDETHGDLRRALFDGSTWSFETVAGGFRRLGAPLSAVMFQGYPYVFYRDLDSQDLLYSVPGWGEQVLDGAGPPAGSSNGATTDAVASHALSAIPFDGKLHVFYDGPHGRYLRHAQLLNGIATISILQDFFSAKLVGVATGVDYQGYLNVVGAVSSTYTDGANWDTRIIHGRRCASSIPCPF